MSTNQLLEEFEKLPLDAQREFSDAILHRTAHFDYAASSDEELTTAAREGLPYSIARRKAMPRRGEVWMVDTFRFRS
jgi:hypothetical protein